MESNRVEHAFPPVFDGQSQVLILGTMPSVQSRARGFYYMHPQNRFWRVLAAVCSAPVPETIQERRQLILKNGFALWDVLASCTIRGSSDSSISDPAANDLLWLSNQAPIHAVVTNGGKAHALYQRFGKPLLSLEDVCLPSTSPANARFCLERLCEEWSVLTRLKGGK